MDNSQELFFDIPFGKMSQTAKRHCSQEFDLFDREDDMCEIRKAPINNHLTCHVGTVGRATRNTNEKQSCSEVFKPTDVNVFQNEEVFALLPFECLPHPQKLRKKTSQRIRSSNRNYNTNLLVDNHLRQLKKRYACSACFENDYEEPVGECPEETDSSTAKTSNRSTDEIYVPASPISRSSFIDNMFENNLCGTSNKEPYVENVIYRASNKESYMTSDSFLIHGNQISDLKLKKDYPLNTRLQFRSSTPLEE